MYPFVFRKCIVKGIIITFSGISDFSGILLDCFDRIGVEFCVGLAENLLTVVAGCISLDPHGNAAAGCLSACRSDHVNRSLYVALAAVQFQCISALACYFFYVLLAYRIIVVSGFIVNFFIIEGVIDHIISYRICFVVWICVRCSIHFFCNGTHLTVSPVGSFAPHLLT